MKILHLTSAGKYSGAGSAAYSTHIELLRLNISSKILFLVPENENEKEIYSYAGKNLLSRLYRFLITKFDALFVYLYFFRKNKEIFSPGLIGMSLKSHYLLSWCDVIHIHWVNHGFINVNEIEKWNKPVIWTLRDMWAFTGGCHYTFNCLKFKNNCCKCPALNSKISFDLASICQNKKNSVFEKTEIHWVAISSWIREQALSSKILKGKKIDLVFSGVDQKLFFHEDYTISRKVLNLPIDKKIILIGANDLKDKFKGLDFILNTLKALSEDITIITFGESTILDSEIKQKIVNFGQLKNKNLLRNLFNASDLFLGPSIAEALGKTFIEAQLCGTPAVAFRNTGPEDIIDHERTGYLARYMDTEDLVKGVTYILNKNFDRINISIRAKNLFSIERTTSEYLNIYKKYY